MSRPRIGIASHRALPNFGARPTGLRLRRFVKHAAVTVLGVVVLAFANAAAATNFALAGQVRDAFGTPVAQTEVEVIEPATGTTVAGTTAGADGRYSLSVAEGTYDVRFTPPATSGFDAVTVADVTVTGDTVLNVVLVRTGHALFSGVLRDRVGAPVPLQLVQLNGVNGGPSFRDKTDADGSFAISATPGTYGLSIVTDSSSFESVPNAPRDYFLEGPLIELTGNRTQDLTLPTIYVDVTVLDPAGNPVPNAQVDFADGVDASRAIELFPGGTISRGRASQVWGRTDSSGTTRLAIFPTAGALNRLLATPPPDTGLAQTQFSSPQINGDSLLVVQLQLARPSDTVPPMVAGTPDRPPNSYGWYDRELIIAWTAVDPEPSSGSPTQPPNTVADVEGTDVLYTSEPSCDPAGNCGTGSVRISLDSTPPEVTLTGPSPGATYTVGTVPAANCSTADPLSGVADPATFTITGLSPDGTGTATATCAGARDFAGNAAAPVSVTYHVHYAVTGGGFTGPVDNPPVVNTGKAGRTYKFEFQLTDAAGAVISDTSVVTSLAYTRVPCSTFAGDPTDALVADTSGNAGLRFDATSQAFAYNWKTPSEPGCYAFFVTLRDGNVLRADFNLS
jgi:hypothetical protein